MDDDLCNITVLNDSTMESNETLCSNESSTSVQLQCNTQGSLPPSIPVYVNYIQAVIVFAILASSISLNGFVIFMISRHRKLHKRAFFLGLNLIVAHFIFSITVLPFMFITAIAQQWMLGEVMCQILGAVHDGLITFRYIFTLVLTVDRMCTVFCPFFYAIYGGKISTVMTLIVWMIALSRSITALKFIVNCYAYIPTFKMCSSFGCTEACLGHTLGYAALLALTGVLLPSILYLMLYWKAKTLQKQTKLVIRAGIRMHNVAIAIAAIPKAEVEQKRKECKSEHNRRAMVTFMTLVLVLVGFALPPYILYTVQFTMQSHATKTTIDVLLLLQIFVGRTFLYGLTIADPIVIMRNQDVREVLKKIRATVRGQRRQSICASTSNGNHSRRPSQLQCHVINPIFTGLECSPVTETLSSSVGPKDHKLPVVSLELTGASTSSDGAELGLKHDDHFGT